MRRLIIEEPFSKAALWSRRLALFALAVAGIGVLIARRGLDPTAVLAVLGAAFLIGCVAILCAGAAIVVIWRTGRKGARIVLASLVFACALLAYPGFLVFEAVRLPVLNDVSTDIIDPPAFSRSRKALAARDGQSPASLPEIVRQAQKEAYPLIQPVLLDLDADDAYKTILKVVAGRGWQIIDQTPPGGRSGVGHIDAIAHTLVLGFPEDVTIRVRPLAGQTRVDLRSASRVFRHDFGSNARRLAKFAADLQAEVDAK
jgi:uncharacterized protein (DUF1499 family)